MSAPWGHALLATGLLSIGAFLVPGGILPRPHARVHPAAASLPGAGQQAIPLQRQAGAPAASMTAADGESSQPAGGLVFSTPAQVPLKETGAVGLLDAWAGDTPAGDKAILNRLRMDIQLGIGDHAFALATDEKMEDIAAIALVRHAVGSVWEISDFVAKPPADRRGADASELIRRIVDWAASVGSDVMINPQRDQEFLEPLGFEKIGAYMTLWHHKGAKFLDKSSGGEKHALVELARQKAQVALPWDA